MAKVRSLGLLPTSLATRALAITFQSVTTSARAGGTNIVAATMPGSKFAAASFRTHIIGRLPLFLPTRWGVVSRQGGHSHAMPVVDFILCDLWTYVTFGRAVAICLDQIRFKAMFQTGGGHDVHRWGAASFRLV